MRGRPSAPSRPDRSTRRRARHLLAEGLEPRQLLATFMVTNNADTGAGSLRQAIIDANAAAGMDTIAFNIGSGPATIAPASALDPITGQVRFDVSTQPGFDPTDPRPVIEINGAGAGNNVSGLVFRSTGNVIAGLAVTGFTQDGVRLEQGANVVAGNYFGLGLDGETDLGNGRDGLFIGSAGNTIGGTDAASRNVISGNDRHGIFMDGGLPPTTTQNNVIQGNYIGTNADGNADRGNEMNGVQVNSGVGNTIGGTAPGAGNVISGNGTSSTVFGIGISLFGLFTDQFAIQGNLIGTNAQGTAAIPNNRYGINLQDTDDVTIGGTTAAARNVISGNGAGGVNVFGVNGTGNILQGNFIGTDVTGGLPLGNTGTGVTLFSNGVLVGGAEPGAGNVIAHTLAGALQDGAGVSVVLGSNENAILSNSIFSNAGLGIDLGGDDEVEPNDDGDVDTGANNLQNYPVLNAAETGGGVSDVRGTLNSEPSKTYTIQLFRSAVADPTGFGEGLALIDSFEVTTDSDGNAAFDRRISTGLAPTDVVTATATDPDNNTSEFSLAQGVEVLPTADLSVTQVASPSPATVNQELTYTITVTNNGPSPASGVTVIDTLPAGAVPVNVQADANGVVTINLGSLAVGASKQATIVVRPTIGGTSTNTVFVQSSEIEGSLGDNSSVLDTQVTVPAGTSILSFGSTTFNVVEGDEVATVTVTRSNGTDPVTVDYAISGGTAEAGADYTTVSGTVSFEEGEVTRTFEVPILDDAIVEGEETILLVLSNPGGDAVLGQPVTSTLTILDNDPAPPPAGRLRLGAATYSVVEGQASVTIPVERVGGGTGEVRVRFSTEDGTAQGGLDYVPQSFEVVFSDGDATPKFVQIPILNDTLLEGNETFRVLLSDPTNGASLAGPDQATVTIIDDEQPPPPPAQQTVTFSEAQYVAAEGGGAATITVERSAGEGSLTFRVTIGAGSTAGLGQDFTFDAREFTFEPGELTKLVTIPILDDAIDEVDETIELGLELPGGGLIGTPGTAVLTILDDDGSEVPPTEAGTFSLSSPSYVVSESGGSVQITIVRTGGSTGRVVLGVATALGSATGGVDYESIALEVVFEDGETEKVVTIPILDDSTSEADETVGLFLSPPSAGALGTTSSAILTITDDDFDPTLPTVTRVDLVGAGRNINGVVLTFSEALDPLAAQSSLNYGLLSAGRDGRFGTRDDQAIPILAALYDPNLSTVLVVPAVPLRAGINYQFAAIGLADTAGNFLDGDLDGTADGVYSVFFARSNFHQYTEPDGDRVRLLLSRGGTLDVFRTPQGQTQEVRLVSSVPGRSVLQGDVRRGRGGDGRATIDRISGLDPFGRVRNRLTTPPFLIGSVDPSGVDALLALGQPLPGRRRPDPRR